MKTKMETAKFDAKKICFSIISFISYVLVFFSAIDMALFVSDFRVIYFSEYCDEDAWTLHTLLIDGLLLTLFYIQHRGMATLRYKSFVDSIGLHVIERSLYVLATALCLQILMHYWTGFPCSAVWYIDLSVRPYVAASFYMLHIAMWILIYCVMLTMDFAELVGLKQAYYYYMDKAKPIMYKSYNHKQLYQHMRHGGILCFIIVLWVHPYMSLARLLLALSWTLYLMFGHRVTNDDYEYLRDQAAAKQERLNQHG